MKNIKKICLLTLAALSFSVTALGEGITVTLDSKPLSFDVPPCIVEGRTLVPLRAIFEAMGATVDWDGDTQTVRAVRENVTVTMRIGSSTLSKELWDMETSAEKQEIELDVPPQIIDDRTLVPARAVAESFGAKVDWDGGTQTVTIISEEKPIVDKPSNQEDCPVTYDASPEDKASYMKGFRILSCESAQDGKYTLTYTLQTYLEGRGDVSAAFECLDESGRVVDSWERLYRGTDYTWSDHTATVTISEKTKIIRLVP